MIRMSLLLVEAPTLTLPRKRRREWELPVGPAGVLLTLLRLRGREGEGVRTDEVIR